MPTDQSMTAMKNPHRKLARKIMRELLADITDRRGWRQEWDQMDDDIQDEIRKAHTDIIERHLQGWVREVGRGRCS